MDGRRGVFIDRDGTLIDLIPYLADPDQVRLVSGAGEALRRLGEAGYDRVVVTNQSGVARGLYDLDRVAAVHERLLQRLRLEGADLEAIEICPHHPDFTGTCACRKPEPGMVLRAAERLGVDLRASWAIGDRFEDLTAGTKVGCRGILVLTGYGRDQARSTPPEKWGTVDYVAWDLPAAVAYLIDRDRTDRSNPARAK